MLPLTGASNLNTDDISSLVAFNVMLAPDDTTVFFWHGYGSIRSYGRFAATRPAAQQESRARLN